MTLLYPLALLGLLPWAAVAAYVWVRRRETAAVPFLPLWEQSTAPPPRGRTVHRPPWRILAVLLAALLALLAASGPMLSRKGGTVAVVVDRGVTMAANGRLASAAESLKPLLAAAARVRLTTVPASEAVDLPAADAAAHIAGLAPTPFDTAAPLAAAVRRALADSAGPVLVVTDRDVPSSAAGKSRVVVARPTRPVRNAGIVSLSVRASPTPQAMVRVAGVDQLARLTVESAGRRVGRDLTPAEAGRPIFLDLPALGASVKAQIEPGATGGLPASVFGFGDSGRPKTLAGKPPVAPESPSRDAHTGNAVAGGDDFTADNVAWAARSGVYPRLDVAPDLSAAVRRVAEVYARQRPPVEGSPTVAVTAAAPPEGPGGPAVVVADGGGPAISATAAVLVRDHPVTRGVRFPANPSATDPPAGWRAVVTVGGRTMVAVRDGPPRGVWVGVDFAGSGWDAMADFVVFFANAFDWVGGAAGGDSFWSTTFDAPEADPARRLAGPLAGRVSPATRPASGAAKRRRVTDRDGAALRVKPPPGLYETPNGVVAVNVPYVRFINLPKVVPPVVPRPLGGRVDLVPPLAFAALALVAFSLSLRSRKWPGAGRNSGRP